MCKKSIVVSLTTLLENRSQLFTFGQIFFRISGFSLVPARSLAIVTE